MKINKSVLSFVMAFALGGVGQATQASLVTGGLLAFDAGSVGCPVGAQCVWNDGIVYGSYWALDNNGDFSFSEDEKVAMTPGYDGGVIIGQKQPPDIGPAVILPGGGIDEPWHYFTSTGWHETTAPVTLVNDYGATKELDFSGWSLFVEGLGSIHLGSSTPLETGLATISCSDSDCSNNSAFVLDYTVPVPINHPSGFGGVLYTLHLEGTVSAVPVPAAAWLFGSGLVGLLGVSLRKRNCLSDK